MKTNGCQTSKPNLFEFATSELTQDAFLVWILRWADKKYENVDKQMNSCCSDIVRKLINVDDDYIINSVEADRQWNNIDVWALINNEYFIVIEDKKGTKEHSDQLRRYADVAKEYYKNTDIKIVLVYFKMEEQGQYSEIDKNGYRLFSRSEMLSILESHVTKWDGKCNDILFDYYCYLRKLDSEIQSYKTLPTKEWHWYSWTGFFSRIQNKIDGNWDYVPNPSGGFLGFWWHWYHLKVNDIEFEIYLQLEYERLVFKLYCYNPEHRKKVRDLYRKALYIKSDENNIKVKKFGRLGTWMGVAKFVDDYRITDDNGLIDIDATVDNLKKAEHLLDIVANELKKEIP